MITRDQIRAANDAQTEVVEVPEWGGPVAVRSLTAKERDELEARLLAADGKSVGSLSGLRAFLVARTVVDADGKRLFEDADEAMLNEKNAMVVDRLATVAFRLSGMEQGAVERAKGN